MFKKEKKRKNDEDSSAGESDWQEMENIKRYIRRKTMLALVKEVPPDITFEVGLESIPFKAHKRLLAFASPVFEDMMIFSPFSKGEDAIKVMDILPDGFKHMLQFIYGEDVCFESEMAAFHACAAADKYYLSDFKKECEAYLNNCALTSTNIWLILENAISFNLISLTNRCLKYLRPRILTFLRLPGFLEVSADTLKKVSSIARTGITVLGLLRALLRWAKYRVESGEADSDVEVLSPVLKHIHFPAMSREEFSMFLSEGENIISPQDAVSIFMHISGPTRFNLPDWCSSTTCVSSCDPSQDDEDSFIPPNENTRPLTYEECVLSLYRSLHSEEDAKSLYNEFYRDVDPDD